MSTEGQSSPYYLVLSPDFWPDSWFSQDIKLIRSEQQKVASILHLLDWKTAFLGFFTHLNQTKPTIVEYSINLANGNQLILSCPSGLNFMVSYVDFCILIFIV